MQLIVNVDALQPPLTGVGHYTRELVLQLAADERVDNIIPVSSTGWKSNAQLQQLLHAEPANAQQPDTQTSKNGRLRRNFGVLPLVKKAARKIPYIRSAKRVIQHVIAKRNAAPESAIYWEPNYISMPIRQSVFPTIHDLSHRVCPQFHPRDRVNYLNKHLPATLARAEKVFTVSEFSRREILREFDLKPSQVNVVYPGANSSFRPYTQSEQKQLQDHCGLNKPYILSVCTLEPRKNILRLVDAYLSLPALYRSSFDLVLIGGEGWQIRSLREKVKNLSEDQGVRLLGYVSQHQLPILLSGATLLAYPSIYEGFGMPVLEAMATGTAVLTSRCTSMEEISGDNAVLVEPTSIDSIAEGLKTILDDETLRKQLEVGGIERAAAFSWGKSANRMIELFST